MAKDVTLSRIAILTLYDMIYIIFYEGFIIALSRDISVQNLLSLFTRCIILPD